MASTWLVCAPPAAILQLPCFKIAKPIIFSIPNRRTPEKSSHSLVLRAIREWREYEDAVREKDLARALRFLKTMETAPNPLQTPASTSLPYAPSNPSLSYMLDLPRLEKDWEVLDTCINADDMRLVGSAYAFLKDRGLLENFGKYRNIGKIRSPSTVFSIIHVMGKRLRGIQEDIGLSSYVDFWFFALVAE